MRLARAICATGEALSVGGQLRLVTVDVDDWGPAMMPGSDEVVVLLRDAAGDVVPFRIDDAFSLDDAASGAVGDYTALVRMGTAQTDPVFVRALDAEVPSFVGIDDAGELDRVTQEYEARARRASFRVV